MLWIYFPEGIKRVKEETGKEFNKQGLEEGNKLPESDDSDTNMKWVLRHYLSPGGQMCNISDYNVRDGYKHGHRDLFEKIISDGKKALSTPKFLKLFIQVDCELKRFTKPSYYTNDCY